MLGAEIRGANLARPLQPNEKDFIEKAWTRYRVLLFRDQLIHDEDHARFASTFGQLAIFDHTSAGAAQKVFCTSNTDSEGQLFPKGDERAQLLTMNWFWHSDGCYCAIPIKGVVLRAVEVAADGGDTLFADMEAAYATLPSGLRQHVDRLVCRHSFVHMIKHCHMPSVAPEEIETLPSACHPVVWRHRDGGVSLFLSPPYMERIDGLSNAETRSLVDELTAWATQERFLCQHLWRAGDVLMWDNRWTMHRVTPFDLACHRRVMRGATLVGTEPVESLSNA